MLANKRILLIIAGGIAAYKCLELIRRLKERGCSVRAIMTKSARQFVTPLSVGALSGDRVYTDLFDLTAEHDIGHIQLSRDADLLVVAPATADLIARMAAGLADDLATNVLLATDKPVLIAPAMNPVMWSHPATVRNVAWLRETGIAMVGPNVGAMAERGEFGAGRMAEPMEILAAIEAHFASAIAAPKPLTGKHIIITSGPTHEPIDPVRYIANRSSGRQGHAIAKALADLGARVTLVSGPVAIADPVGVDVLHVETAAEMLAACSAALPADVAVFAAAVADWRTEAASLKLKKTPGAGPPALALVQNPDILATVAHGTPRPRLVVGFAAETNDVLAHASEKRLRKGCDWIVANDVGAGTDIMGGTENEVHLVTEAGIETWPRLAKQDVADRLAARIAEALA